MGNDVRVEYERLRKEFASAVVMWETNTGNGKEVGAATRLDEAERALDAFVLGLLNRGQQEQSSRGEQALAWLRFFGPKMHQGWCNANIGGGSVSIDGSGQFRGGPWRVGGCNCGYDEACKLLSDIDAARNASPPQESDEAERCPARWSETIADAQCSLAVGHEGKHVNAAPNCGAVTWPNVAAPRVEGNGAVVSEVAAGDDARFALVYANDLLSIARDIRDHVTLGIEDALDTEDADTLEGIAEWIAAPPPVQQPSVPSVIENEAAWEAEGDSTDIEWIEPHQRLALSVFRDGSCHWSAVGKVNAHGMYYMPKELGDAIYSLARRALTSSTPQGEGVAK